MFLVVLLTFLLCSLSTAVNKCRHADGSNDDDCCAGSATSALAGFCSDCYRQTFGGRCGVGHEWCDSHGGCDSYVCNPPNSSVFFDVFISLNTGHGMPIAITRGYAGGMTQPRYLTDGTTMDFKPVVSPDGKHITFFRCEDVAYNNYCYYNRTAIIVMDADGHNPRALTAHTPNAANWNPSWMRDGSDRIIFTRWEYSGLFAGYITCKTCNRGEEQLVSVPGILGDHSAQGLNANEWVHSGFADGDILVDRIISKRVGTFEGGRKYRTEVLALKLVESGDNLYTPFALAPDIDFNQYVHKVFLSPSEKYITYIKNGDEGEVFPMSKIFFAKINKTSMTISEEVELSNGSALGSSLPPYTKFTNDERHIIYVSNGDQLNSLFAYDVAAGTKERLTQTLQAYMYPCPAGTTAPPVPSTTANTSCGSSPAPTPVSASTPMPAAITTGSSQNLNFSTSTIRPDTGSPTDAPTVESESGSQSDPPGTAGFAAEASAFGVICSFAVLAAAWA